MKLSTRIRYGTRALIYIAAFGKDKPVSIREISNNEGISLKYLENIMPVLKSSGIVRSMQGPKGGYILAKDSKGLNLADIVYCLGGPLLLLRCLQDYECKQERKCVMKGIWSEVNTTLDKKLKSIKIKDIARRRGRLISNRRKK